MCFLYHPSRRIKSFKIGETFTIIDVKRINDDIVEYGYKLDAFPDKWFRLMGFELRPDLMREEKLNQLGI